LPKTTLKNGTFTAAAGEKRDANFNHIERERERLWRQVERKRKKLRILDAFVFLDGGGCGDEVTDDNGGASGERKKGEEELAAPFLSLPSPAALNPDAA
jgi:hypothetical protein